MLTMSPVFVGAVAWALCAGAPARAAKIENLNKLGKESYFAYVEKAVGAKSQPKTTAKTVGKLRLKTGEGTDDLVLVIARTTDSKDRVWLKVYSPMRRSLPAPSIASRRNRITALGDAFANVMDSCRSRPPDSALNGMSFNRCRSTSF